MKLNFFTVAAAALLMSASASALAQVEAAVTAEAEIQTKDGVIPPPPAGKGQIVFYRTNGLMGRAISCAVHENGARISRLPPGRYSVVVAEPGTHSYSVRSEATDTIRLEVEDQETQFVRCTIGMGLVAGRPNLSPAERSAFTQAARNLRAVEQPAAQPAAAAAAAD